MSPEQAAYRSDWAGPASDIYSLGVVLYELLCGRVPFRDPDMESLLAQIKERPPVPPRSLDERIPARVEEACLRALDKDPAKRFRTAGDFARRCRPRWNLVRGGCGWQWPQPRTGRRGPVLVQPSGTFNRRPCRWSCNVRRFDLSGTIWSRRR